jgi:hypothetical protein
MFTTLFFSLGYSRVIVEATVHCWRNVCMCKCTCTCAHVQEHCAFGLAFTMWLNLIGTQLFWNISSELEEFCQYFRKISMKQCVPMAGISSHNKLWGHKNIKYFPITVTWPYKAEISPFCMQYEFMTGLLLESLVNGCNSNIYRKWGSFLDWFIHKCSSVCSFIYSFTHSLK